MKNIFNTLGLFIAIFAVTVFTSCNNDNEPNNNAQEFTITATNVQGSGVNRIATVEATLLYREYYDGSTRIEEFVLGEAPFQNRGFSVTLSTDIPNLFLFSIEELEWGGELAISNRNANLVSFGGDNGGFVAFDSDGNRIGGGIAKTAKTNTAEYYAFWIYADKNVTVRGSFTTEWSRTTHFDLNLRSGWNAVFVRIESNESGGIETFTSQRPNNVTFMWEFWGWNDWDDWSSGFSATKRAERKGGNSVFTRR